MTFITYPVGYRQFHPDPSTNYQLNRWLPCAMEQEFIASSTRIHTLADWKPVMLALAEVAQRDGRCLHASTYFRAAEFFMDEDDPERLVAYDNYVHLFRQVFSSIPHTPHEIAYDGGQLSAVHFPAHRPARGKLVVHGGFDSCFEEFWCWGPHFAALGYEVYMFDGPGQGAALRRHGLRLRPDWEVPTRAVLDHFDIQDCALLGISLGGHLAMRAAAFEYRIRHVAALDVMFDRFDCFAHTAGAGKAAAIKRLVNENARDAVEAATASAIRSSESMGWAIRQGLWTSGCDTVFDYVRWVMQFTAEAFSPRIEQDVLLMAGSQDHLVPTRQFFRQGEALTNARSLQMRMFTVHEHAGAHCQVGNIPLVLGHVQQWLAQVMCISTPAKAPGSGCSTRSPRPITRPSPKAATTRSVPD